MNFDEYQDAAKRTAGKQETAGEGQAMASMGLSGESSELFELFLVQQETFLAAARVSVRAETTVDGLKKNVFHAHPLDKEKLKKELGDLLWYTAVLADRCGLKLSEVAEANVEKLKKRYPAGFDPVLSQNRAASDQ